MVHNCDKMAFVLKHGEYNIVYIPYYREYAIRVDDGGDSLYLIEFCPWCGTKLPSSLRDEWHARLESLGLTTLSTHIPEDMNSEAWWKKEGL